MSTVLASSAEPSASAATSTETTITAAINSFIVYRRNLGHSENTLRAYRHDLTSLAESLWKDGAVDDVQSLTRMTFRRVLAATAERGAGPAVMCRLASALKAFGRYLVMSGRLEENPAALIRYKRPPRKLPDVPSVKEVGKALATSCDWDDDDPQTVPRAVALMELLYSSGVRIGEAVLANDEDINWEEGSMRVHGEKVRKERVSVLGKPALEALEKYIRVRDARWGADETGTRGLFLGICTGRRLTDRTLRRIVVGIGERAGIRLHPHRLRAAMASHLVDAGADIRTVQEMLGHASINTTQIYLRVGTDQMQKAIRCLPIARKRRPTAERPEEP